MTIKGVIRHLQAPWNGANFVAQSILVPQRLDFVSSQYMVRTEPGRRDEMIPLVEAALAQRLEASPAAERAIDGRDTGAKLCHRQWPRAHPAVCGGSVTAYHRLRYSRAGEFQRTSAHQTNWHAAGFRRNFRRYPALLSRRELSHHLGWRCAWRCPEGVLANVWLVETLDFPKLNWLYLPIGMLGLLLIGQLAAFGPARRAGRISPALATRTV